MDNWKGDLSKSNGLFMAEVWPRISRLCGGGEIKPVEIMLDNDIARDMDVLCGIDIWQSIEGAGARGIASRVQFNCKKSWDTFTIRKDRDSGAITEYEKRLEAIKTGRFVYPYLTVQSYFGEGDIFIALGIARTIDIFTAVNEQTTIRRTSNASFYAVSFGSVSGCRIIRAEQ